MVKEKTSAEGVRQDINDKCSAFWSTEEGKQYNSVEQRHFEGRINEYMKLVHRQSVTAYERKMAKEREQKKKREESLNAAKALFESADVTTLISLAKLAGNESNVEKFKPGTVMDYLTKNNLSVLINICKK